MLRYESIQTVTQPHSKEGGQIGGMHSAVNSFLRWDLHKSSSFPTETKSQTDSLAPHQQQEAKRGEIVAENVRYGQAISEQGMGGTTTDSSGTANQGIL